MINQKRGMYELARVSRQGTVCRIRLARFVGQAVDTPEAAEAAAREIGGDKRVVKAQVHAGGRGKAGGVKLVDSPAEARAFAENWLGKNL